MYKQCQREQSKVRQRMIAATMIRMLRQKRLGDIQISDLCREAQIPRKTFYRYFDTKEDVIVYVSETCIQEVFQKVFDTRRNMLSVSEDVLFRYWKQRAPLLEVLLREDAAGTFVAAYMRQVLEMRACFEYLSGTMDQRAAAAVFVGGGFLSLLSYWRHNEFEQSPDEMALILRDLLRKPIFNTDYFTYISQLEYKLK